MGLTHAGIPRLGRLDRPLRRPAGGRIGFARPDAGARYGEEAVGRVDLSVAEPGVGIGARIWWSVRRKVESAHQRLRMSRIAGRPVELTASVGRARTILFVCHGNLIRSPFGAALLRARTPQPSKLVVLSAGLWSAVGHPADATAIGCARQFGVDLSQHRTRPLDGAEIEAADVVFAMEISHLIELRRRFPESYDKAYLLGCLTSSASLEVADPMSAPVEAFQACFRQIEEGVSRIVEILSAAWDGNGLGA